MLFVAIFMSLPAICLIYGWRVRDQLDAGSIEGGWRAKLLTLGLCLATLSLVVTSGFLFQGFHSNGQSFAGPAATLGDPELAKRTSLDSCSLSRRAG